jgi:hypothetical protein
VRYSPFRVPGEGKVNQPAVLATLTRQPHVLGATVLFVLLAAAYSFSAGLRATRGASITGDEPFYLLTTQSLIQDGDLDLRQQYERESYRSFFDHPDGLWKQSVPLPDGTILSPHEPGLSILVLPGFWLGGLRGAQAELLLIAALTMALAYVLTALETGRPLPSWWVTCAVGLSATAFVYSTEVYPEFPAALCIVLGLLVVRHSKNGVAAGVALATLLSALAWLGIKYVPLGCLIALFYLFRATVQARVLFLVLAAASGVFYIWFHYAVFGELTAYSVNTVYEGASTTHVIESHLALRERAYRLWGLFIDRRFGIGRWAPILLPLLPSLPLLLHRGGLGVTVCGLIVAQLLMGTFVAITMMGWWFPGRTLVAVLPLFALVLTELVVRLPRPVRLGVAALGVWSVLITASLVQSVRTDEVTLAVDPFGMHAPIFRFARELFPDYRAWGGQTILLTLAWLALGSTALVGFVSRRASGGDAAVRCARRWRGLTRSCPAKEQRTREERRGRFYTGTLTQGPGEPAQTPPGRADHQ